MWNCPKCDESLPDAFAICWRCGTDCAGKEDAEFSPETDVDNAAPELEEIERSRRCQFSLWSLFLLVTCTAIIVGLIRGIPEVVALAVIGVVVSNLFGLILGLFVTYVLRVPNDGSLTWDDHGTEPPSSVEDHSVSR